MKHARLASAVGLVLALTQLACAAFSPPATVPTAAAPTLAATEAPLVEPSVAPTEAPPTPTRVPTFTPQPTAPPLELEIVQWHVWDDSYGDTRVIVLVRNPYDFAVAPGGSPEAAARNGAGQVIRTAGLLFQDGISGGVGFIPPGGLGAANGCFTCLEAKLAEPWATIDFYISPKDATGSWNYTTDVAAADASAAFDGDSAIFDVRATVTNSSGAAQQRIAVQFVAYDQAGTFVGTGEASAWDVPPGAVVTVSSYGIGHNPGGPLTVEVTALGVNY